MINMILKKILKKISKKSLKKNVVISFLFVLVISCFSLSSCGTGVTENDFHFKVKDKNKVEIVKYTGDEDIVQIPESFSGITHLVLDTKAFTSSRDVVKIIIPSSVKEIVGNPFRECVSLESIEVDEKNPSYKSVNHIH